jgi:hypothetical protein
LIRHKEETLPKQELKKLQLERLKKVVSKGWEVPFYKTKMKKYGITPDDEWIATISCEIDVYNERNGKYLSTPNRRNGYAISRNWL